MNKVPSREIKHYKEAELEHCIFCSQMYETINALLSIYSVTMIIPPNHKINILISPLNPLMIAWVKFDTNRIFQKQP